MIRATAEAWKQGAPASRTFAAGSAYGAWLGYFDATDIFAGPMSEGNEERLKAQGTQIWGAYNRPWHVTMPLATPRMIGLDSWRLGYPCYFQWAIAKWGDNPWLNPTYLRYSKQSTPGYPSGMFASGMFPAGMGTLVYPWPPDEPPAPDGRRYVAGSIRLEQLCEGIDDYEYARLLQERAEALPEGSADRLKLEALLKRLRAFVRDANRGGSYLHKVPEHGVMIVDAAAFEALRRAIGEALCETAP